MQQTKRRDQSGTRGKQWGEKCERENILRQRVQGFDRSCSLPQECAPPATEVEGSMLQQHYHQACPPARLLLCFNLHTTWRREAQSTCTCLMLSDTLWHVLVAVINLHLIPAHTSTGTMFLLNASSTVPTYSERGYLCHTPRNNECRVWRKRVDCSTERAIKCSADSLQVHITRPNCTGRPLFADSEHANHWSQAAGYFTRKV